MPEDHPCFDACKDVKHEFCMGKDCEACKGCDKDGCPDDCSEECQEECGECAMCMMMADHLMGHPCNMFCGTEEHPGWCYENCMGCGDDGMEGAPCDDDCEKHCKPCHVCHMAMAEGDDGKPMGCDQFCMDGWCEDNCKDCAEEEMKGNEGACDAVEGCNDCEECAICHMGKHMMEEMMKGDGKGDGKGHGKDGDKDGDNQHKKKGPKFFSKGPKPSGKFFTKGDDDKDGMPEDHPCFDACKDVKHEFCMGKDCKACHGC